MKEKHLAWEGIEDTLTHIRRDGNTTRLVDNAIQILFKGHICIAFDHHEEGRHNQANDNFLHRITDRLMKEHHLVFDRDFKVNIYKFEIVLCLPE